MNFYPAWPPLLAFAVCFALAGTRALRSADAPPSPQPTRSQTIDGLRGFLALSVVMFHGAIYHRYIAEGVWAGPPSAAYTLLGTGGVAVFFMITGYLFWGKLIDERGRPHWARLYLGRLFRIGPLYLVVVAAMLWLVMEQAGWRLLVTPFAFAGQVARWLALGLLDPADINGHVATLVLTAGVTWSLRYEWLFYLSLPVLSLVAREGRWRTALLLVGVCGSFAWCIHGGPYAFSPGDPAYVTLFLIGAACAALHRDSARFRIGDTAGSVAMLLLLCVLFATCGIAYAPLAMALLGAVFLLVVSGCTVFGLLTHRAARRLGDISYGIYLLQGIVLAALFQLQSVRTFALRSPLRHWTVVLAGVAILVVLAAIAHAGVERPGIRLGRRLAGCLWAETRRSPTRAGVLLR